MQGAKCSGPQFIRGDAKFFVYVGEKPETEQDLLSPTISGSISSRSSSKTLLSLVEEDEKKVNSGAILCIDLC